MTPHLALYTFGIFREPADGPANAGFHEANDPILALVERAAGFIDRAGYDDEPEAPNWGAQVYPRFYEEKGDGWSPATLSLWEDVEAVIAFAYSGLHGAALRRGKEWFMEGDWPPYALWWTAERPTWRDAVTRYELLHDFGPGPDAFTFRAPLAADGAVLRVDQDRVAALAAANARL